MAVHRRILVGLPFALVLVMVWGATPASTDGVMPGGRGPARVGVNRDRFMADLKRHDFDVAEGGFQLWGIEDCPQSFAVMGTCYFNNPAAPYVMAVVPYWPDEFVDPAALGAFGPTEAGYGTTFRLDPNEAIVIYGFLPPKAAYFGLQSYLFTRKGAYQTDNATYNLISAIGAKDVFFHAVPYDAGRVSSFDSISDANNNVTVERQSGASWNQFRYFIITPDPYMDAQVRQALHQLSVRDKDIFTERIPSNMTFGLDADADDFVTGIRYSMPADGGGEGTLSNAWRQHPALTLLRVRDARPHRPDRLYPPWSPWLHWPARFHAPWDARARRPVPGYPAWRDNSPERRTAVDEWSLEADLTRLVQRVSEAWGQPCSDPTCSGRAGRFIDTQSPDFNLVGPKCDNIGMDCLGDTQDASYQFRGGYTFDDDEVYAVVGTLGTATGNATYVSLGVNNFRLRLGAENVEGTKLAGSADAGWYPGVDNLDQLYVYYFTRHCEGLEALTHGFCLSVEDTPFAVPPGVRATIVERDYMRPGTGRGPDSRLTLPSTALKLRRPAQ